METDFTFTPAPIVTYDLVINDRYTSKALSQFYLSFKESTVLDPEGVEVFSFIEHELPQLKEHLSEMLDELPQEKWNKENVMKVVDELMKESVCSYSIHKIRD